MVTATRETIEIPAKVAGHRIDVVTHANPHADELLALFLMEEYGTEPFLRRYAKNGQITVGVGGGPFDDHNRAGEKASSAMLVAKALDLTKVPQVAGLISHVHRVDSEGGDQPFNVCALIKLLGSLDRPFMDIVNWASQAFWAKCNELAAGKDFSLQHTAMLLIARDERRGLKWLDYGMSAKVAEYHAFHTEARDDFRRSAQVTRIMTEKGPLTLVAIESDASQISRYARSDFGANASIVIVRKSSGNVAIMTDRRIGLDLRELVASIKLTEQQLRGVVHCEDVAILGQDGTVDEEWDVWHYAHGDKLLNGSHSARGISPTVIPFKDLVEMIIQLLDPAGFDRQNVALCSLGICPAVTGSDCVLHCFQLARCQRIRNQSKAEGF